MPSSSNKGVVAVVGAGCAIGLLFALGYLLYWLPKQKADEAKQEIEQWSTAWAEARSCLIGSKPDSSDPAQALTARELRSSNLQSSLAGCMNKLKPLRRGEGFTTEDEAIESAWHKIEIPVSKLAQAQAWIGAKEPNNPPDILRANLASAILEVDAANLQLRKAGGLKAAADNELLLAKASSYKVLAGPEGKKTAISNLAVEPGAITYLATAEDSQWRAKLTEEAVAFEHLSPLALHAIEAPWGLWVESDGIPMAPHEAQAGAQVMAGQLDGVGEPSGQGVLLHTLKAGEHVTLRFAIGDDRRTALFRLDQVEGAYDSISWRHILFTSEDAGKTFVEQPLPGGELWVALKASTLGNYLSWQEDETSAQLHVQRLTTEGSDHQLLQFGEDRANLTSWPPELCLAPNRSWWLLDGAVYTMGADARLVPVPGKLRHDLNVYEQTVRCTDQGLSLASQQYGAEFASKLSYQTCTVDRCAEKIHSVKLPSGASYQLVFHKSKWHALVLLDQLAAIWNEDDDSAPTRFVDVGRSQDVVRALSWPAGLLLLAWPAEAEAPSLLLLPE